MEKKLSTDEIAKLPFMNSNLDLEKRVEDLLGRLTLEEKYHISSGRKIFHTKPIDRLGVKSFRMTDGPHGVGTGLYFREKTTYFPVAICRAATWNPELSEKFGIAIAQEVRNFGYHMLLAPGVNIQRTPLCGRTFEYQSEDPHLNKILTIAVVKGLQSQRIAACVKHFVANNQETKRLSVSSEVSERALHEIYFPAFEASVREADAWSFMSCYNKVNGIYGSENKYLLIDKLRDEWGFRGFVVSDWGATTRTKGPESCINGGLTLEMPGASKFRKSKLRKAFSEGKFNEETLNENIRRLLRVMFLVGLFNDPDKLPKGSVNTPEHQAISRKTAEEGIVLLKNKNNLLPLNIEKLKKIAVIGPNAKQKMAAAGGSSMVRSLYEITPYQGIEKKCEGKIEITEVPSQADVAIVVVGLNHKFEMDSEGKDRKSFDLPTEHVELINGTVKENANTIVVLINGSPVPMDGWIENVPAVIEGWYAGMDAGNAIADVIFGDVNPSGKLPMTFPKKLSDSPAHKSSRTFPGNKQVFYDEGIFVGYRHFDKENIEPLFPFGYGLSYTTFKYENLQISKKRISKNEKIRVSCDVVNSGKREGAEVVQLYVQDVESSVERPVKELKGFKKINLKSGEKGTVTFELEKQDLSFYDEKDHCWKAESGIFKLFIGSSSRDIRLQDEIEYKV
ncbi:MAG: glycoside hydrolase family 3 C-terminal domain-containing protein [Candidatus Helarchaeota archaeon]|nr:glycoside hydrolase family 3 C-terminal domain-containing protein [Candidatus Helarchaeota archaeon]